MKDRIVALRQQHPGQYQNASAIRTNAMKFLPNYFRKGQLEKIFFLFPVSLCCAGVTDERPGQIPCQKCRGLKWEGARVKTPMPECCGFQGSVPS